MCCDLDQEDRVESDLPQRFLVHAQARLERPRAKSEGLNDYLDGLFANALKRCADDAVRAPDVDQVLGMQSLVMARRAGFLARHIALNEDPLRKRMEATLLGYAEVGQVPWRDHHSHAGDDAHHGHDHGHGHGR
ncbi:MAG: hypothetical protein ABIO45_13095 [Burkholderiaceae bacterium]